MIQMKRPLISIVAVQMRMTAMMMMMMMMLKKVRLNKKMRTTAITILWTASKIC